MASHVAEIALRKKISEESDNFYGETCDLGAIASRAFKDKVAQIRNLENIANSATRVADILDFIKRQTGRREQWREEQFGQKLLERLDSHLDEKAGKIFEDVAKKFTKQELEHGLEEDDRRRIHILLCREFIRHLSAHYLYTTGLETQQKGREDSHA